MTLLEKQHKFTNMVAQLILRIYNRGYQASLGEAWRSASEAQRLQRLGKGIGKSLHTQRLAIDLNLFKDGQYLDSSEDHKEFGEFWESIGGSWGGRFGDGNHYSLEHEGRK